MKESTVIYHCSITVCICLSLLCRGVSLEGASLEGSRGQSGSENLAHCGEFYTNCRQLLPPCNADLSPPWADHWEPFLLELHWFPETNSLAFNFSLKAILFSHGWARSTGQVS